MSSATNPNGARARQMLMNMPMDSEMGAGPSAPLSPRQQMLDHLWSYFRCTNYSGRKTNWDGSARFEHVEHEMVATSQVIPPGFYDAGQTMPLDFRHPTAPYYLGRVIVKRFTGLLFSKTRKPRIMCDDPKTEDWLTGFAEATRLWSHMSKARDFGGAMGSVGLGFKFVHGKPFIEVFDPRWSTPEFSDRSELRVASIEVRYQYVKEVRNEEGEWEERWFWHRRVIDGETDTVWPKVAIDDGAEPIWELEKSETVNHRFGECPVVWIQNIPVDDDIDGDPDCHGIYDLIHRVDAQLSQADVSTIANCDPTTVAASDAEFDGPVQRGSSRGAGIQVEKGGSVQYLEMTGAGVDRALKMADKLEEKALTVARCVLDRNEDGPARTVEEIEHNYSSMIEEADLRREQYGELGVKRLLEMVLRVAKQMSGTRVEKSEDPETPARLVRDVIVLPKRRSQDDASGEVHWVDRELGTGTQIELTWPPYFKPSLEAIGQAVDAAGKAKTFGLIDQKHATGFIAPHFDIDNVPDAMHRIKQEQPTAPGGFGAPGDDVATKVAQRTMAGARSALPNPTARLMPPQLRGVR